MSQQPRPPRIHHCTSEPYRFFGRAGELALLDQALAGAEPSVVALVGPGGQGKTAIVQHWLERLPGGCDGVFLWSFYRGKDADLCLRELYAYAAGLDRLPDVAASFAVDQLLAILRAGRWAIVFDGTEVVQYDSGAWRGRFIHPELGRLLEELAGAPLPGVVVLTTRFELPTLTTRLHGRVLALAALDAASARGLLTSLGVQGTGAQLDAVAAAGGHHAKAVELLGTYLRRYHAGQAALAPAAEGSPDEEQRVGQVLALWQRALPADLQDVLALATAFRDPPTEPRLLEYLASPTVGTLLHETWGRTYAPFAGRPAAEVAGMVQELVALRLLERVGRGGPAGAGAPLIDAHPLVRRAFEHNLGSAGQRQSATARAGFLRGRPDRRRPESLEEAREEVEMFHAYCDAGLWNEADSAYVALDNPKHRFLVPALERDLLCRFFPEGDWRQPPRWPGFGRQRSLAICFELLGQFGDALAAYREGDAALRGDALIALGQLQPLLDQPHVAHTWSTLWHAYRAHALCLAGRVAEGAAQARVLVPVDIYEWLHVFECLLRAGQLAAIDLRSVLFRPPHSAEHRWADLARRRMRADYLRVLSEDAHATPLAPEAGERGGGEGAGSVSRIRSHAPLPIGDEYRALLDAYDRGGLPYERCLARLGYARWLLGQHPDQAASVNRVTLDLAGQHHMPIVAADAWDVAAAVARQQGDDAQARLAHAEAARIRATTGFFGPARP